MVGVAFEFRRNDLLQLQLHFQGRFARRKTEAVAQPEEMGVHRDRRFAEGIVEHHIRRLAANAGQRLQCLARAWNFAAVIGDERVAEADDILRLHAEKPDGLDRLAHLVFAEGEHGLRRGGAGEERDGGLVHALVGCLGREHHGNQQRECVDGMELTPGLRVGLPETAEHVLNLVWLHSRHMAGIPQSPLDAIMADPPQNAMAETAFRAVLTPSRSLSRQGFIVLMAVFAGINAIAATFFIITGAWPVAGFMGLDVLLLWLAFHINNRDGRWAECIELTPGELVLERIAPSNRRVERRFIRHWVRVELEEDRERELIGRLYLSSHGQRTEIASFLGAEERKSFAEALRAAL